MFNPLAARVAGRAPSAKDGSVPFKLLPSGAFDKPARADITREIETLLAEKG